MVTILNLRAVDEDRHVMTKLALIVENVAARLLVRAEVALQSVPHGPSRHIERRTRQMTLNIPGESYNGHAETIVATLSVTLRQK